VLVLGAGPAKEPTGREVLDRVRAATSAQDRKATAQMKVTDRNGRVSSRTMRMVMKGDERMMMTFSSPADLAGVTFLTTSTENMWIYLPAQARVRRISGSMANQGFGGSDFSYKEMANISLADESSVLALRDTAIGGADAYLLDLEDKDKSKSRLWVEKARFLPLALEQLGPDGKVTKRVVFGEFARHGEAWIPCAIEMHDLARGSKTELRLSNLALNTGVRDNFFVEANMKKGA